MVLNFFGRESGFGDEHTSAYFTTPSKEMVIIDLPATAFFKLKKMDLSDYDKFYVLITHTHDDHIGLLGLWIMYAFFTLKKPVFIIAPSQSIAEDLSTVLTIGGNDPSWYTILTAKKIKNKEWFNSVIPTQHAPHLKDKCFGYNLIINNKNVVYTSDTITLEPFLPYLTAGSILYTEASINDGSVHLLLKDALKDLISITKKDVKIYLMHLDNVSAAETIIANYPDIEIVTVI